MYLHTIKRRRTQKPATPVPIDKNHPLAKGLFLFAYFVEKCPEMYNAVTNRVYSDGVNDKSQTAYSIVSKDEGLVLQSTRTPNLDLKLHPNRVTNKYYTFLGRTNFTDQSVAQGLAHVGAVVGAEGLYIGASTDTGQLRPLVYCGASLTGTLGALNTGWHTWGAVVDFSTAASPAATLYVDGKPDGSSADIGSFTPGSSKSFVYCNVSTALNRAMEGYVSFIAAWEGRKLNAREIAEFTQNPWQLLEPETAYLFQPVNASITGSTTINITSAAAMAFNQHPEISGAMTANISANAGMTFNRHPEISGALTIDVTPAAGMTFNRHPAIAGNITISVSGNGTPKYNFTRAISGAVSISVTANASMLYASGSGPATVRVKFTEPDGTPIAGATVRAVLNRVDINGGLHPPVAVESLTDNTGEAILLLWPNTRGIRDSRYRISARHPVSNKILLDDLFRITQAGGLLKVGT